MNGEVFVIDNDGKHWVKFEVEEVPVSPEKPHGLKYSLSLHDASGTRLVGFDNAHGVKGGLGPGVGRSQTHDHRHRIKTIRPYDYTDAASLLSDFWARG
ncbi:MAG: toxin-antitoxin system TumE family protein [Sphingosinicella sp.]